MSRIETVFNDLRQRQRKALVVYLTAGDPDFDTSLQAALAAVDAGADVLEIGVPFSDPIADGPVIQRAMTRAIDQGGGLAQSMKLIERIRERSDVPIVVFGYVNPLLYEGMEPTLKRLNTIGADGVLVVDVPPEESHDMRATAAANNLDWISLIAPTTSKERAQTIAASSTGFLYLISMKGVTGGALNSLDALTASMADLRKHCALPLCVGFGVRDKEGARRVAQIADGVVVGSAIVAQLEAEATAAKGIERLGRFVAELRAGIDAP